MAPTAGGVPRAHRHAPPRPGLLLRPGRSVAQTRYEMELACDIATADYTDEHQVFGGISFPTPRRAVGREPDGTTVPDPAFVTIDIEHVSVESVV